MNSSEVDILLVDDSPEDVELTLHGLRSENFANRVFIARDGEEALDFLFCSGAHVAIFRTPAEAGLARSEVAQS